MKRRKKKQKLYRGTSAKKRIKRFAKELRDNLPRSERWFQKHYKPYKIPGDVFNHAIFRKFIPDLANPGRRYIVEVDGSIHDQEHIRRRDLNKNQFFGSRGFHVIRVKAYDMESFRWAMARLEQIRSGKVPAPNPSATKKTKLNSKKTEVIGDGEKVQHKQPIIILRKAKINIEQNLVNLFVDSLEIGE